MCSNRRYVVRRASSFTVAALVAVFMAIASTGCGDSMITGRPNGGAGGAGNGFNGEGGFANTGGVDGTQGTGGNGSQPPNAGNAAKRDCTDGVDCYCDRVRDAAGPFFDPDALMCEDFEAATLHENINEGGGPPLFGPWWDHSGCGWRGCNSYWTKTYGPPVIGWKDGQPSSPQLGSPCPNPGSCGTSDWRADNLFNGNTISTIDVVRDGEFDDEVANIIDPQIPGGHSGVFDGKQSLGLRNPGGNGHNGGIMGEARFGGTFFEIGTTAAMAYPANSVSSGVWRRPWKHEEFGNAGGIDSFFVFHRNGGVSDSDPFQSFMLFKRGQSNARAVCEAAVASADLRRVEGVACNDIGIVWEADTSVYQKSRDWPWDTWGCAQNYVKIGDTIEVKTWFNGVLIVDFTLPNASFLRGADGYHSMSWNNYSNEVSSGGGLSETTYRYIDNYHIRHGAPVSCEQIGFVQ